MARLALIQVRDGDLPTTCLDLFDRRALPVYRCLATMTCLIFGLAGAVGFSIDRHDLPLASCTLVFLAIAGMVSRSCGVARLGSAVEGMVLIVASLMATCSLSLLLATLAPPYQDVLFDKIDHILLPDFTWMDMFRLLRLQRVLIHLMSMIYSSLFWQPLLLVAVLSLTGSVDRMWRFLHAWYLTLVLCVTIFAFMPALGPYAFHRLSSADIPAMTLHTGWRPAEILGMLRNGELRSLKPSTMQGLIAFPSFHAASGTLLAFAYRRVPMIGMPFVVWNVAMIGTAPLMGSHYFCDILAGIAAALIATLAVRPRHGDCTRPDPSGNGSGVAGLPATTNSVGITC